MQGKAQVKVSGSFGSWLLAGVFLLVSYSPQGFRHVLLSQETTDSECPSQKAATATHPAPNSSRESEGSLPSITSLPP